jgi:hypothetical protein
VPGVAVMLAADLDAWPPNGAIFIAIGRAEVLQRLMDVGVIVDHDCRIAAFCHLRAGQVCPQASHWPE